MTREKSHIFNRKYFANWYKGLLVRVTSIVVKSFKVSYRISDATKIQYSVDALYLRIGLTY